MLTTLSNVDSRTAQGILATVALGMMPDPGIGSGAIKAAIDISLRERLLQELRIKLRLKRDDHSANALAKLYGALAEEMKQIALKGEDLNTVKARVGQRGLLGSSQYQIKFAEAFRDSAERCGISRYQAESAIRHADSYEHLMPEHFGIDPNRATSLFMKIEGPTAHSERYILLVFANRKGSVQEVISAWRVYPSDVDLRGAVSPRDVLRAFAETFGATFTLGDKEGKFFTNEKLAVTHDEKNRPSVELFRAEEPEDMTLFVGSGRTNTKMGEAVLSFAIDYKKYTESLKRHGINVNLENIKAGFVRRTKPRQP